MISLKLDIFLASGCARESDKGRREGQGGDVTPGPGAKAHENFLFRLRSIVIGVVCGVFKS